MISTHELKKTDPKYRALDAKRKRTFRQREKLLGKIRELTKRLKKIQKMHDTNVTASINYWRKVNGIKEMNR